MRHCILSSVKSKFMSHVIDDDIKYWHTQNLASDDKNAVYWRWLWLLWNGDDDEQEHALYALEEEKTWSCIMNILEVLANAYFSASRQAVFSLVRMRICLNPNPYFPAVTTAWHRHTRTFRNSPCGPRSVDVLPFSSAMFGSSNFWQRGDFLFGRDLFQWNHFPFLSLRFLFIRAVTGMTDGHIGKVLECFRVATDLSDAGEDFLLSSWELIPGLYFVCIWDNLNRLFLACMAYQLFFLTMHNRLFHAVILLTT